MSLPDSVHVEIIDVDYRDPRHAADLVAMLDHYARDPMGGSTPLSDYARENLATTLAELPHVFSLLAYASGTAVGFANCIESFSTFACRRIVNIHDIAVRGDFRGKGVARKLMERIEAVARERDCCKLTLEVLEGNRAARSAYDRFGFRSYELEPGAGRALFLEKPLG